MNAYEATIVYCGMIGASGFRLANNYMDNFAVENETSPENIFTIPIDAQLFTAVIENMARSCHYNHGAAIGLNASNGTSATVSTFKTFG